MDQVANPSRRGARAGGAVLLLAGLAVLLLPEPIAAAVGLVALYAVAIVAVVSGAVNVVSALRVREITRWLLPASVVLLVLGCATLAAPAALGSALARAAGGAIALLGGLTLFSAYRTRVRAAVVPVSARSARRSSRLS
jgi:uncharacterized membrane protein HdeD (DUF308 family)